MIKYVRFTAKPPQPSETIPFFKNKLLQIAGNLIPNTIKFTPENGSITVGLDLVEDKDATVLQIKVKDPGSGNKYQCNRKHPLQQCHIKQWHK
jgi:signal transduction histidine kinase